MKRLACPPSLSAFLFLLLLSLICVMFLQIRRPIMLCGNGGPSDTGRERLAEFIAGSNTLVPRWLDVATKIERCMYRRAKGECTITRTPIRCVSRTSIPDFQSLYPPTSTGITFCLFSSIYDEGVSALTRRMPFPLCIFACMLQNLSKTIARSGAVPFRVLMQRFSADYDSAIEEKICR